MYTDWCWLLLIDDKGCWLSLIEDTREWHQKKLHMSERTHVILMSSDVIFKPVHLFVKFVNSSLKP